MRLYKERAKEVHFHYIVPFSIMIQPLSLKVDSLLSYSIFKTRLTKLNFNSFFFPDLHCKGRQQSANKRPNLLIVRELYKSCGKWDSNPVLIFQLSTLLAVRLLVPQSRVFQACRRRRSPVPTLLLSRPFCSAPG